MVLTPRLRQEIDAALAAEGYLSELEEAFRRGDIEDYPLFPQGQLTAWDTGYPRIPLWRHLKEEGHITESYARSMFRDLEAAAAVRHVKGRGFYGLRRALADLTEDETKDSRVLRALGGWADDSMRRRYQKKEDPKVLAKAAEVLESIWGELVKGSADPEQNQKTGPNADPNADPA